jgi:hypothetical protein
LIKKIIGLPSFSSLYSLSFSFSQGSERLDDVKVIMIKKKKNDKKGLETTRAILRQEVKIYEDITNDVLESEIKGNKTRKDYNALIDPVIVTASVRSVFNY